MRTLLLVAVALLVVTTTTPHAQQARQATRSNGAPPPAEVMVLSPTTHPPMPHDLSTVWLAPDRATAGRAGAGAIAANAARLFADAEYAQAEAAGLSAVGKQGPLVLHAAYYVGAAQLRLEKPADALRTFRLMQAQKPVGYLAEAALRGEAEALLALDKPADAVRIYEGLLEQKPSSLEDVLVHLGRAAKAAGDLSKAADAFARVYYEFALSESASVAGSELALLPLRSATPNSARYKLELGRAARLFGARRYKDAREAFENIESLASGDDRELIKLRIAESDYFLKRHRAARDAMKSILEKRASRQAEAMYFYAVAARDLGDAGTYLTFTRRVITEFPDDSWAEESLNSLGTYYVVRDEDDAADAVFREMIERFPNGNHAERAAWKAGWRAYRDDKYEDTVRYFEQAAANFPRSDYRPSWLYWAARAHEKLSNRSLAGLRHAVVVADYMNSYYGRLSAARLGDTAREAARAMAASVTSDGVLPSAPPANAPVIKALLGAEMYDDALNELRYARRTWGDSAALQATVAWIHQQQSRSETGMDRFQLVRGAINTMRRAYPQFMTADGEALPHDVQTVIYPLAYWDLIRRYSAQYELDPYLVAALVLQESTFVADVRSHANAYGLMQLLPSTARQYARKLSIPYSSRLLTSPEMNIRMGTAYFADKIREFGGVHLALASYNAGERPVRKWMAERQGLERDEFIDDIPYPETQGYVRKILGIAEDYRRLYGAVDTTRNGLDKTPRVNAAPSSTVKAPDVKSKPVPKRAPARRPRARAN